MAPGCGGGRHTGGERETEELEEEEEEEEGQCRHAAERTGHNGRSCFI